MLAAERRAQQNDAGARPPARRRPYQLSLSLTLPSLSRILPASLSHPPCLSLASSLPLSHILPASLPLSPRHRRRRRRRSRRRDSSRLARWTPRCGTPPHATTAPATASATTHAPPPLLSIDHRQAEAALKAEAAEAPAVRAVTDTAARRSKGQLGRMREAFQRVEQLTGARDLDDVLQVVIPPPPPPPPPPRHPSPSTSVARGSTTTPLHPASDLIPSYVRHAPPSSHFRPPPPTPPPSHPSPPSPTPPSLRRRRSWTRSNS